MNLFALSLLLLAPPSLDYGFVRATEDFVIESCPKPIRLADHAPPKIADKIMQFGDPCYKCRERAAEDLKAMGDEAVPWLFWGLRHKHDAQIRLSSWRLMREMCACHTCNGTGQCVAYRPSPDGWTCLGCGSGEYAHTQDTDRKCRNCKPGDLDMTELRF